MSSQFVPYYERVMADLRAQINDRRLRPGDKLPSTDELAAHYGYSPGTVREAITRLIAEGVLRGHRGVGVFVAES
jgi:GntR family transcriptional regulator